MSRSHSLSLARVPVVLRRVPLGRSGARSLVRALPPCLAAVALLALGYQRYAWGTGHAQGYQQQAYAHLRYSDIIWLYLRDHLATHPVPYLDYRLEYPVLLGFWMYLLSFTGSLSAFFAANYALLAGCALLTVVLLGLLDGADRWRLALAPALVLYTGLNWDMAAIAATVLGLVLVQRRRDRLGALALTAGVWLKLFPLVFLAAVLWQRLRRREFRRAGEIAAIFAGVSLLLNLPLALANWSRWSYFFTFNNDRAGNANLWVLWSSLPVERGNLISLGLLAAGGLALVALAWRARVDVTLPLGAGLLVWWLAVNKIFSPQYALWVFLAMALVRAAWPLWTAFAAADLGHFGISWLLLHTASVAGGSGLVGWENDELREPVVLALGALMLLLVVACALRLWGERPSSPNPFSQIWEKGSRLRRLRRPSPRIGSNGAVRRGGRLRAGRGPVR
ncbi:MAG TPA: hypothetical protein VFI42_07580 [Thermomicrobiaceae bacterium]|nr:hypothetical protein [Thermomicrobiaceae bacterium]